MTDITRKTEARAEILKAMAQTARLLMLEEQATGERCVCELREMVGTDLSVLLKDLSVLRNCGLVEMKKRGRKVLCSLTLRAFRSSGLLRRRRTVISREAPGVFK